MGSETKRLIQKLARLKRKLAECEGLNAVAYVAQIAALRSQQKCSHTSIRTVFTKSHRAVRFCTLCSKSCPVEQVSEAPRVSCWARLLEEGSDG